MTTHMFEWLINNSPLLYFTQSIWRDEAFSILIAERPISSFIGTLSFEPPVYYTLLHFWMKIFGNGEIAARSLSFVAFAGAVVIVIFWAEKLFAKSWMEKFVPLLFFFNPMLLYYAFEIRTYGLYIFFITLSMYAYTQGRYRLLTIANTLGFYTHSFFIFVPFIQGVHFLMLRLTKQKKGKNRLFSELLRQPLIRSLLVFLVLIAPWMVKIGLETVKLKQSWYFPVNIQLIKSVLGNLYLGYEGTPWYGWQYTRYLSLILLAFMTAAYRVKQYRPITTYLLATVFIPLSIVIGISFFKPLFVNRYMIFVSIAMVFLISYGISAIKINSIRIFLATIVLGMTILFNFWYPKEHPKTPIRDTLASVNRLTNQGDLIYATSSLVYFETVYYADDRSSVRLYNPHGSSFPWYVGDAAFSQDAMISTVPIYPKKAFFVNEDGSYSARSVMPDEIRE